ncbi:MAG: hypothetical protein ACI9DJ_001809 [Algoriphagus sp.]|jgi:hypothetical protein
MRYLVILFLCITQFTQAQKTDQAYLLDYKSGVQAYALAEYQKCLDILTPLTASSYTNPITPYTLYYYSLASMEVNKAYQAREMLRKLIHDFPDWNKIDEAFYLYGFANFKDEYYQEGISYLERINSLALKKDSELLLQTSIPKIENIILLKELNQSFPDLKIVAETIVNRIQERKYNIKVDLELSDRLTNLFKLTDKKTKSNLNRSDFTRAFDDDTIDFGILLPFDLAKFDVKQATSSNRYVYDMFTGMEMGLAKIRKEGILAKLYGFDVGKNASSIENYMKDENFKKIDLIFGPLYGRPNKVVETYAQKNKIYQVHPISNSQTLIQASESRFLVQASNQTQAINSLDFVATLEKEKIVSIYYSSVAKDSILAHAYSTEAKKRGYKISECKVFNEEIPITQDQKVGHVFIAGDSKFGPKVLRALGQAKADSVIIASDGSFNLESVTRQMLSRDLYIIQPQFINTQSGAYKAFKKKYIAQMKMLPSYYAYLGYDMILFYSRMLKNGREIFRLNLNESPKMDDLLLSGFDYSKNSFENKVVPIVKYNQGNFEIVNSNE